MSIKNPPSYGVRNVAIERRIAGEQPASLPETEGAEPDEVKAEPAPDNKAARKPSNKGKK